MEGSPSSFWGKLDQDESGAVLRWHPLIDHCADVAACALAILELPTWRSRVSRLGRLPRLDPTQLQRLAALAALHDLGKFNHGFQARQFPGGQAEHRGHVTEFAELFDLLQPCSQLRAALPLKEMAGWVRESMELLGLLFVVGSHHGDPLAPRPCAVLPRHWRVKDGVDPFAGVAKLAAEVRLWLPQAFAGNGEALPATAEFQHAFAGLVMLADWLGSDTRHFPYTSPGDPPRFARSLQRARALLEQMHIAPDADRRRLDEAGPEWDKVIDLPGAVPNGAQRALAALPLGSEGSVEVIEAETGSGKTEAAIFRYLQRFHAGHVDGMYFALPTRAAATQIHGRVLAAARRVFGLEAPPVVLAVPGYLRVDDVEGRRDPVLPRFEVLWPDERERFRFRSWFAEHPKRYLVGPIVVGTIDQVLLSALRVSHAHLRATALLRHLLVVDEVHSSDAYMTAILERALRHHVGAGGHALLMSATLGASTRQRLVELPAFALSAVRPLEESRRLEYPLITVRGQPTPHAPVAGTTREKAVQIQLRPWMDAADAAKVARLALDAAKAGARVAVLRNTVKGALEAQEALEAAAAGEVSQLFRVGEVVTLHHSRFAAEDRKCLDLEVERRFGKGAPGRSGCAVVATQTIEQSLDIDLDLLVTDLCPMDVLLQRIGRVHRHGSRDPHRPDGFRAPTVVVLTPAERDLGSWIQTGGKARGPHGLGTVYEDLRILEATWALLERHSLLVIPRMNRELVEDSTHPEALASVVKSKGDGAWREHEDTLLGKKSGHQTLARMNCYDWSVDFGDQRSATSEERILTRLGAHDRLVELQAPRPRGPFGADVASLKLPGFLCHGLDDSDFQSAPKVEGEGTLQIRTGRGTWTYDRLGLRRLGDAGMSIDAAVD